MPRLDMLVMQRRDLAEMLSFSNHLYSDGCTRQHEHGWFDRMKSFMRYLNSEIDKEQKRG